MPAKASLLDFIHDGNPFCELSILNKTVHLTTLFLFSLDFQIPLLCVLVCGDQRFLRGSEIS